MSAARYQCAWPARPEKRKLTVWLDSFCFRAGLVGVAHEKRKQCRLFNCGRCRFSDLSLQRNLSRVKVCSGDCFWRKTVDIHRSYHDHGHEKALFGIQRVPRSTALAVWNGKDLLYLQRVMHRGQYLVPSAVQPGEEDKIISQPATSRGCAGVSRSSFATRRPGKPQANVGLGLCYRSWRRCPSSATHRLAVKRI